MENISLSETREYRENKRAAITAVAIFITQINAENQYFLQIKIKCNAH